MHHVAVDDPLGLLELPGQLTQPAEEFRPTAALYVLGAHLTQSPLAFIPRPVE